MHTRFTLLLALLALLILPCGACQQEPVVLIVITGALDDVTLVIPNGTVQHSDLSLPVAQLHGQQVSTATRKLRLSLPNDAAGLLYVQLDALSEDGCVRSRGSTTVEVPIAIAQGLTVDLLPYGSGCQLALSARGGGQVSTTYGVCRGECVLSGREAEVLTPVPDQDSYFLGWSGACAGLSTCNPTIPPAGTRAMARFAPKQICSASELCWELPLPSGVDQHGIWTSPAGTLWTVGSGGTIRRNDTGFFFPEPADTRNALLAIWGRSDQDVWTVGRCGVVRRFDGNTWQHASPYSEEKCATDPDLLFVFGTGAREVWVGGEQGALWRFDGERWEDMTRIFPVAFTQALNGGHGLAPDDVWFVRTGGLLHHFDGVSANYFSIPAGGGVSSAVLEVSPSEVWVGGQLGRMFRFDGQRFSIVQVLEFSNEILSLWRDPSGGLWAAGAADSVARLQDGEWHLLPTGISLGLGAISGRSASDVWALGLGGVLLHWDGANWLAEDKRIGLTNLHVSGADTDSVWFAGAPGSVLGYAGSGAFLELPSVSNPVALAVTASTRVWVLNSASGIELATRVIGGQEARCAPNEAIQWIGLLARGAPNQEHIFAVGEKSTLLNFKVDDPDVATRCVLIHLDQEFKNFNFPTTTLRAVWQSSPLDLWLAGDGFLASIDLVTGFPFIYPIPPTMQLISLSGTGPDNVWAASSDNQLLHVLDGKLTPPIPVSSAAQPTETFKLTAVHAPGPNETWAVGSNSFVVQVSWQRVAGKVNYTLQPRTPATLMDFQDVWGASPNDVWLTGTKGQILRYRRKP